MHDIYEAMRDILANDTTLSELVGANKVFIGRELPKLFIPPALQIIGMTDNISEAWFQSSCVIRINAYAAGNADGSVPMERLAEIQAAVCTLLEGNSLAASGARVFALYIENRDADCIRDVDYGGEAGRYLMGTEWRLLAA